MYFWAGTVLLKQPLEAIKHFLNWIDTPCRTFRNEPYPVENEIFICLHKSFQGNGNTETHIILFDQSFLDYDTTMSEYELQCECKMNA